MGFRCPECSTPGWLVITQKIELPYDSRSDEIQLQIVKCGRCRFEAIAVYEESSRGRLDDESIDHRGYYVSTGDLKKVKSMISNCPDPKNARCRCWSHRQLGSKDKSGRWNGLADIEFGQRFEMQIR